MVISLVLVSTSLVIGVWIMSSVQQSFDLPTDTVVNESIDFVANNTYYSVDIPYINAVSAIYNDSAHSYTFDTAFYAYTASQVKLYTNGSGEGDSNISVGVAYVDYTYNLQASNDSLDSVFQTTWSSFQLGVVMLIVLAAVSIIGILISGFGKAGGPA